MINTQFLSELIAINSCQLNEKKVGNVLAGKLKKIDFNVKSVEIETGRLNIFATKNKKKKGKAILFYGHLDTVAPVNDWDGDPFKPLIKGNRLQGLGAYDMKGGIVAFLEATRKISDRYIKIFLASDEERESFGAWHALENNKEFFADIDLIISAEPNFDNGINSITVGRTGRFLYRVTANGKAAHIAKKNEGIDAIELLSRYLTNFYNLSPQLQHSTLQAYKLRAESIGMSVCAQAWGEIEALVGMEDGGDKILNWLRKINTDKHIGINYKKRRTPYLDSYYFKSFKYQKEIGRIIKESTNKSMKLIKRHSVGDDNVLASLGIPVITWGPDGGGAHGKNEWVDIKSLNKLADMYRKLLI